MDPKNDDLVVRLIIFLKGMCMGIADVIPGVSGGTMALILGIYERFVDALKNINLRWVYPLFLILTQKNRPDLRDKIKHDFGRMDFLFLLLLGSGIIVALGAGSAVIPYFIDNHPAPLRALFFGLILASAWLPATAAFGPSKKSIISSGFVLILFLLLGFFITSPGIIFNPPARWIEVESSGGNFDQQVRRQMSLYPARKITGSEQNNELNRIISRSKDDFLPAGTRFFVPRPALWFLFLAGGIAITAMILPGISGSYILLIIGCYYFILNCINSFRHALQARAGIWEPGLYLLVFAVGILSGLLIFSRILSYFLHNWHQYTMAALTGLMLGCLRGVWPFRSGEGVAAANYLPAQFDARVGVVVFFFLLGFIIVVALTVAASDSKDKEKPLAARDKPEVESGGGN